MYLTGIGTLTGIVAVTLLYCLSLLSQTVDLGWCEIQLVLPAYLHMRMLIVHITDQK
jgi:hypothetical protein